ncbi:MAG: single-stranded-DNA-specific exonuclease RecJ [Bacteroidota bacterium]
MTEWILPKTPDSKLVDSLSQSINVNEVLASILVNRGVSSFESAKAFFRPDLEQLHDPFLMHDMDKAVERLTHAIANNEKILVYGDYDVDGTTSVALVFGFLSEIHSEIDFYIPNRYTEGYGLSKEGVDWAYEKEFGLIITLDCGIKANENIKKAKDYGIDVIVCDHHNPPENLPEAYAILDPKKKQCNYPYKELSGCGVGFKLLHAFCMQQGVEEAKLFEFIDLLAVSIAADIVPITGENRILTYHGLKKLAKSQHKIGLHSLIRSTGMEGTFTVSDVVFKIAPRINAAGRMEHAKTAVELLICCDPEEALNLSQKINGQNSSRREIDTGITEEILEQISSDEKLVHSKTTVLYNENWNKGVIGIAASRSIEKYYRPTIILTKSGDKATGSARSVEGFDIHSAIEKCADLLDQFGGHKYAAGMTLPIENIPLLQEKFEVVVSESLTEEHIRPKIQIDAEINLDHINYKFFNILKQMEPFGPGNMTPVFLSRNCYVKGHINVIKEKHLKFMAKQSGGSAGFQCLAFNMLSIMPEMEEHQHFDMAYTIEENNFRGERSLQLYVKDVKFNSSTQSE